MIRKQICKITTTTTTSTTSTTTTTYNLQLTTTTTTTTTQLLLLLDIIVIIVAVVVIAEKWSVERQGISQMNTVKYTRCRCAIHVRTSDVSIRSRRCRHVYSCCTPARYSRRLYPCSGRRSPVELAGRRRRSPLRRSPVSDICGASYILPFSTKVKGKGKGSGFI